MGSPFYAPGQITVLTGPPGSGKSNYAHVMMEVARKQIPEIQILSNTVLKKKVDGIHFFKKASTLLWYFTLNWKRGIVIFDEAGVFSSSGASDNRKRRGQMEIFAKLVRKFNLSLLWIDQRYENSVPPTIRDMATTRINFPERGRMEIYKKDNQGEMNLLRSYRTNTLTRIPYDHMAISSFHIDLGKKTFHDVFDYLGDTPGSQIHSKLQNWLLSNALAHPKTSLFSSVPKKERVQGEDPGDPDDIKKDPAFPPDPERKVPTRTMIYGILQRNPRARADDIARILKISPDSIYLYRKEYRGKIKIE